LLGALFIGVSIRLGMLRKIYINTSIRKVLEAITFAFVTASIFYLIVMIWSYNCIQITTEDSEHLFQFYCTEPNTYNPLATLVFNTEGGTIR
jgi:glycerol uptake facilitator-like aquaporin